jgi:nucleoside-diphosphate-sugar epimerase
MAKKLKVFLTGATGNVGRVLLEDFKARYDLKALYRKPQPDDPTAVLGDLNSLDVLRRSMDGADVVVHLAAFAHEADFMSVLLPNNIVGAWNVFHLASEARVRRVVFASTCNTMPWPTTLRTLTTADEPRPTSIYGATKVFGEAVGRHFHDHHGLEVIHIRIGWLRPYEEPGLRNDSGKRAVWLSPRDTVRLFRQAVEKPGVDYAVVYGTSITPTPILSLAEARELLDYVPEDDLVALYGAHESDGFPARKVPPKSKEKTVK